MKALHKEQKASNAVHLFLYWNVLSFSFISIEFSLDKAFKWLCRTPLPLQRGEREGITYTELTYILLFYNCSISHFLPFHLFTFPPYKLLSICYFFNV